MEAVQRHTSNSCDGYFSLMQCPVFWGAYDLFCFALKTYIFDTYIDKYFELF